MVNTPESELNAWQKVAAATNDLLTPANVIDAAAFGLGMHAGHKLEETSGIAEAFIALSADFVDGKVARATGTASPTGEAIDAGGDKVKLVYYLFQAWRKSLVPKPLLVAVGIQNGANVAITAYDRKRNPVPKVHPSMDGKRTFAMEEVGMGLHVIGSRVTKSKPELGRAIKTAGTILTAVGLARGIRATKGYWDAANS